jgi:hypothetical protein
MIFPGIANGILGSGEGFVTGPLEYTFLPEQSLHITIPRLRRLILSTFSISNRAVDRGGSYIQRGQFYHARYHDPNENIFFKLQHRPIPDIGVEEPIGDLVYRKVDLFPLYEQIWAPDAGLIQDFESRYIYLFLQKLPVNMGFAQLFPSVFCMIFAHSMSNEGLRFMVLSVSSFLAENMKGQPPLRSYRYLQLAIPKIQQAMAGGNVDDALIYSVFLAAYLHLIGGELASTRRHLEGLRLLLERYHVAPGEFGEDMPAELMFIWRMAIRMDHQWALGDQDAIFPLIPKQDDSHRQWVQRLVDYSHPEMVEWALAQFALDDLVTRAIAINKRAIQIRSSTGLDEELTEAVIRSETLKLLEEHRMWKDRPCVKTASDLTKTEQQIADVNEKVWADADTTRFLHYPPLKISNKLYGAILLQYHWVLIYITFITHPKPGPYPYERFQAAIDVCRTYASVGWPHTCGACRVVLGLYLTGLTFGEPMYPKGTIFPDM